MNDNLAVEKKRAPIILLNNVALINHDAEVNAIAFYKKKAIYFISAILR